MRCIAFLSTACPLIGSAWPRLFGATKRTDDINRSLTAPPPSSLHCHSAIVIRLLATFREVDLSGAYFCVSVGCARVIATWLKCYSELEDIHRRSVSRDESVWWRASVRGNRGQK
ncbi:hypothetical protein V8C44DRAFT_316178 [Trichoderma aethiopicum]